MAKPRVFVSSTHYDLKHIRSALDLFIDSLGYEAILSEKGSIAYNSEAPLDESCYREVSTADIFILIVGGRYGSESSGQDQKLPHTFYKRYESITKKEFESAVGKDIPTYILIESNVHAEYYTFLQNKGNEATQYAHVDSVNIFRLIEEILALPRNNPVQTFDRFSDIEAWLRDQWAGLFRDLLSRSTGQKQIATLTAQVEDLREINNTLKRYLEALMSGVSKDVSREIIKDEERRLEERERRDRVRNNSWTRFITGSQRMGFDEYIQAISKANSFEDFAERVGSRLKNSLIGLQILEVLAESGASRSELNEVRRILGLAAFKGVPKAVKKSHRKIDL